MKNIIIGIGSVILICSMIVLIYTQAGRSSRQTELENSLTSAMETAMNLLAERRDYAPKSDEEFVADFMEAFLTEIKSYSDVEVNILDVDYKKGLLSVEAVIKYTHPNGKEGAVSAKRTMILEDYKKELEKESYTIDFTVNGKLYKSFTLKEDSTLPNFKMPEDNGKVFKGWKDIESGEIVNISNMKITQNRSFVAVFD